MTFMKATPSGLVPLEEQELADYEAMLAEQEARKIPDLIDAIKNRIKSKVDAKIDSLKNGYSEREIQSWPVQLKEAEALLVDPSAPTPFLSNAKRDSETVEEYAAKVRANNAAWSSYAGQVVNWRAEMEDALDFCVTDADYETLLETINNA